MSCSLYSRLYMCVCGLFLETVPWRDETGVSHTSMEYLYFTVFTLKMNECILTPEPQSLTQQAFFFFNIFLPVSSPQ